MRIKACNMENLRKAFRKENDIVGRVKRNGSCKKHPKHSQSPGVCSLCLREKLTQLSASISSSCKRTCAAVAVAVGSSISSSSVSSLSSYYSSSSSSSCASPMHCFCFNTHEGKSSNNGSSLSIFLLSGQHGIIKSKSLNCVPRRRDREGGVDHHDKSVNKSGFCFKLLRSKNKDKLVGSMSILSP